jgi:hypothetical protein
MTIGFVAFAFQDSINNGGEAVKLGFLQVQSYKVAKQTVWEGVQQEDGRIKFCDPVKRREGDTYFVNGCILLVKSRAMQMIQSFCYSMFFRSDFSKGADKACLLV